MAALPLDHLQRWMQEVVVHPGRRAEAVDAARPLVAEIGDVILPSATLEPAERVGIYHGMYLLRMHDALQSDYPHLQQFLGAEGFRRLVRDYVQVHPSKSYTLNRLGDHLPAFLGSYEIPRAAFATDIATLELAMTEAFDAEETEPVTAEAAAAVPETAWADAVLRPIAALRLVALRYPVPAWMDADEGARPSLRRAPTFVLVYRRNYQVFRQEIPREAHDLLAALVAGRTLGASVEDLLRSRRRVEPDALFRFFRQWMASGVFRAIELPAQA